MKFAYYTDMHISGVKPLRRKDNFVETAFAKFEYILEDSIKQGATFRLNGGDLNEIAMLAPSVVSRQANLFTRHKLPEYSIIGNHDVIGSNSERIDNFMLGVLFNAGTLSRLSNETPVIIEEDGIKIAVFGVDIHKDMDNLSGSDYYVKKPEGVDYTILVAHGWLSDKPMNIEGVRQTTFEEVVATGTEANLILTGHDHGGHSARTIAGITFYNPGSPVRCKAQEYEMIREVGYAMIALSKEPTGRVIETIDFIKFPAHIGRPAEEVLDRDQLLKDKEAELNYSTMQSAFSGLSIAYTGPRDLINDIAKEEGISDGAKEDLIRRLDVAEEELQLQDQKSFNGEV